LAADWKKEGVDVRFFVMSKLVTETIPSEELNYSLQPVVSYKSKEYIPGYYDAYPAPAISPRFINVGSQTLVIVYPR